MVTLSHNYHLLKKMFFNTSMLKSFVAYNLEWLLDRLVTLCGIFCEVITEGLITGSQHRILAPCCYTTPQVVTDPAPNGDRLTLP